MESSDLLIIIGAIGLAVYSAQSMIIKKLNEIEEKTEKLLGVVDSRIESLEHAFVKRLDVLTEKFDDVDMEFIDDVLKDVDAELLTAREHKRSRQYMRELEIKMKKEAEEKRNAFVKSKNAVAAERDISE